MKQKFSKKAGYKYRIALGDVDARDEIGTAYMLAFKKGYSVVEIARYGGFKSAKIVHAMLVKNDVIPHGKPGPQPKGTIPKKMRIHLTARGLTFAQWCAGWGFDQVEVKNEVDQLSGAGMAAIKQDFPGYYKLLTGIEVKVTVRPEVVFKKQELSGTFEWDPKESCYRTEIMPSGSVGYGPDIFSALKAAQHRVWIKEIVKRLEALPDKKDLEPEPIW